MSSVELTISGFSLNYKLFLQFHRPRPSGDHILICQKSGLKEHKGGHLMHSSVYWRKLGKFMLTSHLKVTNVSKSSRVEK